MGCLKINSEKNNLLELAQNLKNETNIDVIISAKDAKNVITLKFQSGDQMINCYILCKENDIFNSLVNKVFEKKPEFREYGNYFLCGGNVVNEYKTIKENKIKDGNTILLIKREEEEGNEIHAEKIVNNPPVSNNAQADNSDKNYKTFQKEDINLKKVDQIILTFIALINQDVHHSILCNRDELFCRIVEKLLDKYPKYKRKNISFICRALRINEYLTVEENSLLDNDMITIIEVEGEEKYFEYSSDKTLQNENNEEDIDEQIIVLKFQSKDNKIQDFVKCKMGDTFNRALEKLYKHYPAYKEQKNIFMLEGKRVHEYLTMKENNLKNRDIIIFQSQEEMMYDLF